MMAAREKLLVLLIEDDMDIAATVSDFLALEGVECDHAYDGEAGLELARSGAHDVILLDVMLPFRDGLDLCGVLRREGVDTPVLMLTARDSLDDKLRGFAAGADDYLIKPFALEELLVRLRVLSRRRSGEARRFVLGDLALDFERRSIVRGGRTLQVSPAGWIILEVLARHSPGVVSRAQLETALWGGEPPDSNAVKVHLYKLRQRLDKPFAEALLQTVPGQGFALRRSGDAA